MGDASDPPPRHQPAALIWQHVILHDRTRNRGRFVGRIVDDADELRGHGSGHAPSDCPAFRPAMVICGRAYGPQPWGLTEATGDNLRQHCGSHWRIAVLDVTLRVRLGLS